MDSGLGFVSKCSIILYVSLTSAAKPRRNDEGQHSVTTYRKGLYREVEW
jgi:hypothetical protein